MHYLIDGHNLIGKMPDIQLSDPDDEMKLVMRLRRWTIADPRRQVTVIFDGGIFYGKSAHLSGSLVNVIFSSRKQTADALLIRRIKEIRNPREYVLITSDREIIKAARDRRLPFLRSESFTTQILSDLQKRAEPKPTPKPPDPKEDPTLSEDEVNQWLAEFGPVNVPPPRPYRRKTKQVEPTIEEPPPEPRTADELKESGAELTEEEIAEWYALFGGDAATVAERLSDDKAPPPDQAKPGTKKKRRHQTRSEPRPANMLKQSGAKLSRDEVDEWLSIFREEGKE